MSKRKYLRLLNCHLLNKKIKFNKRRKKDNDIKFRFEREGSYLKEYYMSFEDSILTVKLNAGRTIYQKTSEYMVYSLEEQVLCIVSL